MYVTFQGLLFYFPFWSTVGQLYAGHVFVSKQISRSQIKYNKGPGQQV